jgi:molybdopterin converting factor small subunit
MKGLFEQHYIDIPEEKYDVLGDLQEQLDEVGSKLDEQLEANVALAQEINEMKRAIAISEATDGMVDTDAEKFNALAEELAFEDVDSFKEKLQTIKENYFGKKTSTTIVESVVTDEPVQLTEEVKAPGQQISPEMARYLRAFNGVK